jgi:hypothetical protein
MYLEIENNDLDTDKIIKFENENKEIIEYESI